MADLRGLKMTRANIKGQMTRLNNRLVGEMTTSEAKLKREKVEELWQAFEEVQNKIEMVKIGSVEGEDTEIPEDIREESDAEREVFENIYYEAATKAQKIIDADASQISMAQQVIVQAQGQNEAYNDEQRDRRPRFDVKLPTLKLPEFNGDYNEWLLFKDAYTSMIHDNAGIARIEKFQYLRNSLKGEALQVIGGLEISAENYENAWELLEKSYENTRLLVNTHLNNLLDFPVIAKDKPATIRQLIVHIRTHLKALKTLNLPVEHWDELLIHLTKSKFDYVTKKDWEEECNRDRENRKTLEQYLTFLNERCRTLELIDRGKAKTEITKPSMLRKQGNSVSLTTISQQSCSVCQETHAVFKCPQFLEMSVPNRIEEARAKRICLNCLGKGHLAVNCKGSACKKCGKRHNTLLHLEQGSKPVERKSNEDPAKKTVVTYCATEEVVEAEEATAVINFVQRPKTQIVLSTARVRIEDANGVDQNCRVLLDPGSQSNLITEDLLNRLKLKSTKRSERISGVNQVQTTIGRTVQVKIKSIHTDDEVQFECLVLPRITEKLPQLRIDKKLILIPEAAKLADPSFYEPGTIDLLVGAGLFWELLCSESYKQAAGLPKLQKTLLGWIVGGELIDATDRNHPKFCGLLTNTALQSQLERFWNQEETYETRRWTNDEAECERQFCATLRRDADGRFIVALPQKSDVVLGESETQAKKRLLSLERRFKANPEVRSKYLEFMGDYEHQGHMSIVPEGAPSKPDVTYILPHQPVIRPDNITTKLRVVFDASAKTSIGTALNDRLMIGPNLQKDLFGILLRFRAHEYVLTADIAAMFRQIWVREEDRDLQRILWRSDPTQQIQLYRLNTVTYGTAPAPYLAIRCLRQLAEEDTNFPQAARALVHDFYMDDVLTGANTIEKARVLQQQLSQILQRGQFHLRKWRSNDSKVLENLSQSNKEANSLLTIDQEGALKTLGLLWDAKTDTMQYKVAIERAPKRTKRIVLSTIAQIFDPLGLLGPVIINAKCIMQRMWQLTIGWDDSLPEELQAIWDQYYSSLPKINEMRILRNINPKNSNERFDLIGFGDASEKAYGACLYAVSKDIKGKTNSHLISSKSRVAPLKTISLPKLELNAALLLAKLCDTAREAFRKKVRNIFLWSDSTIVLSWIASSPNIRKTYVANRVTKIQNLTQDAVWLHVPTKDNPADLISRGMSTEDWMQSELWWHGPAWLISGEWPERKTIALDSSEMRVSAVSTVARATCDVLRDFSCFDKMQRVIAYCLRFKNNTMKNKRTGALLVEELAKAEMAIARMAQEECFAQERLALGRNKKLPDGSKLAPLSPFLDENDLIRVGGRLSRASIPETQKHPIILPDRHHVTKVVMAGEHRRLHHCGPEQLLHSIRQRYWILSGRREARKVTRACLICYRRRPKSPDVPMGDLPQERVRGSLKPFTNTGVDYAGPLQVRESRRRGRVHSSKAWIAVFTCFATKATHLELVTELSAEAFLAALRRFVARRGIASQIVSDNGTNFVGAARELKEVHEFLEREQQTISDHLSRQKIQWRFIPPRAPHFGGLWEAAVKATKRHLNAVTKGLVSTFEEYYTLLAEIESILNSRPLTPLSSNPDDLSVLTPAHFLVGDSLLLPAEHNYLDIPDNRFSRWQHLQKVRQHFWKRWSIEYLQELQRRHKWNIKGDNVEIGTLVLIREDSVPPLHWVLGRVVDVHPGADNVVRVATVRTPTGLFKRAVKKLCPLPIEEED